MFQKEVLIRPVCSLLPKEVALYMASCCLLDNYGLTGKKGTLPVEGGFGPMTLKTFCCLD